MLQAASNFENSKEENRAQFARVLPSEDESKRSPATNGSFTPTDKWQRIAAAFLIQSMPLNPFYLFLLGNPGRFVV
jgi:hypothetical protein